MKNVIFSYISQGTLKLFWFKGHFYEGIISVLFHFQDHKKVKDHLALLYIWFTCTLKHIYFEDLYLQLEIIPIQGLNCQARFLLRVIFISVKC